MTVCALALWALAQEEPRVVRAARLDESTVLFESPLPVTVHVVDTERGRGEVLWSAPGLALARVPRDAARARVISGGRSSEFWPLAEARPVTYGQTPSNASLTAEADGIVVQNAGPSAIVVVVRVQEPERRRWRFLAAVVVVPAERRAIPLPPGSEAVLVRPEDATGGLHQAPPEPPAAARRFGGALAINDGPLAWRGLELRAGGFFTRPLIADLPASTHSGLDGFGRAFTVRVEVDEKQFEVFGFGLSADLGLVRVSAGFFAGEWEGRGDLTVDDGIAATAIEGARLEGELLGVGLSAHWPGLAFRGDDVAISLGPEATALWIREELDGAEGSPIGVEKTAQEILFAPGVRASFRVGFVGVEVGIEGAVRYAWGDLEGMMGEVALAVLVRF